MGKQEKKETKGKRRRRERRQWKSTSPFPVDLTSEILSRLPGKSIARFRCVSKLWSSIITDPYFINLFETRSSTKPSLLLCVRRDDNLFVSSITQDKAYSSSLPIIDRYHMKLPDKHCYLPPAESVHGLICLRGPTPIVWNPSLGRLLTLPDPNKHHKLWKKITVFLGYDPIQGKHKVVCIRYKKDSYVCRVLTLGSAQEPSWRTVKINHKHRAYGYTCGRCINEFIYYLADDGETVLMSFDVRSEKFHMIKLPSDIDEDVLINYEGKIACTDRDNDKRLWILEDAEKHKWSSQDFLVPLCHWDPSLETDFKLKGFTHAGEFIFEEDTFQKTSYILSCDPVRNSFRRFVSKGVRVGDDDYEIRAFPNHVESLMSL
ncbi:unnamed protein product [Microthlaspi erraticum]|uniref:F-box domain-containing protein n=1 Tax=Microthlaspi erraticum TaxID=1685480 RepID=A0A6D2HRE5_9BRAS|nr:unnamed protein product [Microthlaspi erraticum]